jgi:AcrR family transcriptional regulator
VTTSDGAPPRLRPGRHGLPRPEVEEYQRRRLLDAMISAAASKGYTNVVVADVLEAAGVSRATFYALFDDKLACLLEAQEMVMGTLVRSVNASCAGSADTSWEHRVKLGLTAVLEHLAENPDWARFCLIEVNSAGPEARKRQRDLLQPFMGNLDDGFAASNLGSSLPPQTPRMSVTGAAAMLLDEVQAGNSKSLPERLPDLLFALLVPFIGPAAADAEIAALKAQPQPQ